MSYTGPLNAFPGGNEGRLSLYGYTPNRGFNIFAAIAWGLVLVAHLFWLVKKRTRAIQGLIVFGCIWELIGYAIRAHTHTRPFRLDLFIAQYTILHVAPIFFIMALVNALGWGMRGTDNAGAYDRFKPRSLVSGLQALNVIILILVTIGSAMFGVALARTTNLRAIGYDGDATRKVLIAGHALKIVSLLILLAILTHLLLRFNRYSVRTSRHHGGVTGAATTGNTTTGDGIHPTTTNSTAVDQTATNSLTGRALTKMFLGISWLTAGMLLTRTCYRLAETAQNVFRRSWNSEILFGLFEFAVTWVAVAIWAARPFATQLAPAGILHNRAHDHSTTSNKVRV